MVFEKPNTTISLFNFENPVTFHIRADDQRPKGENPPLRHWWLLLHLR